MYERRINGFGALKSEVINQIAVWLATPLDRLRSAPAVEVFQLKWICNLEVPK